MQEKYLGELNHTTFPHTPVRRLTRVASLAIIIGIGTKLLAASLLTGLFKKAKAEAESSLPIAQGFNEALSKEASLIHHHHTFTKGILTCYFKSNASSTLLHPSQCDSVASAACVPYTLAGRSLISSSWNGKGPRPSNPFLHRGSSSSSQRLLCRLPA